MFNGLGSTARVFFSIGICASSISSASATDKIVYAFKGLAAGSVDPYQPEYGVVAGPDGKLYGTSRQNGDGNQGFGNGAIYQVTLRGSHPAVERVIYRFKGGTRGSAPEGPLVFDGAGNAYGTTPHGGKMTDCQMQGCGTVFKLTPPAGGTGQWTQTVIHRFSSATGSSPKGALTFDSAGNLYGATWYGGGDNFCTGDAGGCGVIYKLSPPPSGTMWTFTVLHQFQHQAGAVPNGGLVFDANELTLYGTTQNGGAPAHDANDFLEGVVFKLRKPAPGHTNWVYSVIYNFDGPSTGDGRQPNSGVIFDAAGNLYGTTLLGGDTGCNASGCGIVFKLAKSGSTWTKSNLHVLNGGTDGRNPYSGLTIDGDGNLYGTASAGGGSGCFGAGCGTVFQFAPSGMTFNYSTLHSFQNGLDGALPYYSTLLWDGNATLYGVSRSGGANSDPSGTVYSVAIP